MKSSSLQISTSIRYDYRRYLKFKKEIIDPYEGDKFKYKELEVYNHQAEKFKNLTKQSLIKENSLKIFDDASLKYDATKSSFLQQSKLDLSNSQITENGIGELANSEYSQNIEEINLSFNQQNISDLTLRLISDSNVFRELKIIILKDTAITDHGIKYMFEPYQSEIADQITGEYWRQSKMSQAKKVVQPSMIMQSTGFKLTSSRNDFAQTTFQDSNLQEGTSVLIRDKLPKLQVLILTGNQSITDVAMKCFSMSQSIKSLQYLDVSHTKVTDIGICAYFYSMNSENLKYIDISNLDTGVTSKSLQAFAWSQFSKNLVVLKCQNSAISDLGIQDLADSPNTTFLEELDISKVQDQKRKSNSYKEQNFLTDKALHYLSKARYLQKLEILNISGLGLSEFSLNQLVYSDTFITILELYCNNTIQMNDSILQAIGDSDKTKSLQKLYIHSTTISENGLSYLNRLKPEIQVLHSIQQLEYTRERMRQNKAGIRCFSCEMCWRTFDNNKICQVCKRREINSIEFPCKLCDKCGIEFAESGFQRRKCFLCKSQQKVVYPLFRCVLCSIGYQAHHCVQCQKKIAF